MNNPKIVQTLTIAGSDSGGGAGIQADLKTFQMQSVFGTSVITAVTAQNTLGVWDIHAIPTRSIHAQLQAIQDDFDISACKVGMLGTVEIIECVANFLAQQPFGCFVLDPVMIAKGGAALLQTDAIKALTTQLLPLADVITPNIPEAEALTGIRLVNENDIQRAARVMRELGAKNIIIKGGHWQNSHSQICRDWVFPADGAHFVLDTPRYDTPHTHGTGCTFSACLTAELAKGQTFTQATHIAKSFITAAISHPLNIGHGHGSTNHWAFSQQCQGQIS